MRESSASISSPGKRSFWSASIIALLAAAISLSAYGLNYNASKSNTGNIVVHPSSVSEAQAAAVLAEIDKVHGASSQPAVRGYLTRSGVKPGAIAKIVIEQAGGKTTVLLLDNASDETKARGAATSTSSRSNTQHN